MSTPKARVSPKTRQGPDGLASRAHLVRVERLVFARLLDNKFCIVTGTLVLSTVGCETRAARETELDSISGLVVVFQHVVPVEAATASGPPPSSARSGQAARVVTGPSLYRSVAVVARRTLFRGVLPRSSPPAEGGPAAGARSVTEARLSAPARRRSPRRPSKSRWCVSAVNKPSHHSPSHRFRERRAWMSSLPSQEARRVVPRGMPQGRGGCHTWEQPIET